MVSAASISPGELDELMYRGWPGLSDVPVDGWIVRRAGGVTQRANSVLPFGRPRDLEVALRTVEALYREQGLPAIFQLSPATQPPVLDSLLSERGYARRSPTLVQVADVDTVMQNLVSPVYEVAVDEEPNEEWMRLWWSIDGRGGREAGEIAHRILLSCPAIYASSHDGAGIAAVGRLAVVGGWGGIYCMAVREDVRHRGHGRAILRALLQRAAAEGIQHAWLQVVEDNWPARALYVRAGFRDASRYHYRVHPNP